MELKGRGDVLPCALLSFQSHLYGIERFVVFEHKRTLVVSIAPLWNWKQARSMCCPLRWRSFNRTFMELKVDEVVARVRLHTFQSHLYGIEREAELADADWIESFNRTFMELKVGTWYDKFARMHVSIAPLWNWKFAPVVPPTALRSFQSHLYGIERVKMKIMQLTRSCFNRTFMELKDEFNHDYCDRFLSFNRTFMELKVDTNNEVVRHR